MTYWVKRIMLKSGELVTERELTATSIVPGPAQRGRQMMVRAVAGNSKQEWSGQLAWTLAYDEATVVPLRVEEIA